MSELFSFDKSACAALTTEPEVEAYADKLLRDQGFHIKHRKIGKKDIDKCWPSKSAGKAGSGAPDLLVFLNTTSELPFCVWENKAPTEDIAVAINEAKFYVEGLHQQKPAFPNLPRLAAGFNGKSLRIVYFNHSGSWVDVRAAGTLLVDQFPRPSYAVNGVSANGNFNAYAGSASPTDIRRAMPALKTLYRSIPALASGRRPIDFTVALLTLKMLVESERRWGTWAEQPGLVADATSMDDAIAERFESLTARIMSTAALKSKYGDIFQFREQVKSNEEVAFDFLQTLRDIERGQGFFFQMFSIIDELPPLHGAHFDVFGEVYQALGDDATKKALGEFFTGRHIISSVVPILFERAGVKNFNTHLKGKRIADIACGTGGFLTETLRYARRKFKLNEEDCKAFAAAAFYGFDLSQSNASRARVNMYFAGDGFSTIDGGIDSLANQPAKTKLQRFDFVLTNPPYGTSSQYQRLEEAFLRRVLAVLEAGSGWGLVVLPTGALENPRSAATRMHFLKSAQITDVMSLPSHAFAPYTQQRTAIVIFQKRPEELPQTDWASLLKEIENEEIGLFIVDNDGFANSDKRYETTRTEFTGEWLHDDLRPYIDTKSGKTVESKLFRALIQKQKFESGVSEFGEPLGSKSAFRTIGQLTQFHASRNADKASGIELLPDTYLRPQFGVLTPTAFLTQVAELKTLVGKGAPASTGTSVRERVKKLMATTIDFTAGSFDAASFTALSDSCSIVKGDQGLTEAIIYREYSPTGVPVYGGGESTPKFLISSTAKTKSGSAVTLHKGPALIVSMDGSSGAVRVIPTGNFVSNHHAAVLSPRKGKKINLHFLAQQLEGGLRSLASNREGSATLTLPTLTSFRYQHAPDTSIQKAIGAARAVLASMRDQFQ